MDIKAVTQDVRLSNWADAVRRRNESGKTAREWCRENGIHEKKYYYWQKKLREAACEEILFTVAANESSLPVKPLKAPLTKSFAEIKLESGASQTALPFEPDGGRIHVKYGEIHITADDAYSPGNIATLLKELLKPC